MASRGKKSPGKGAAAVVVCAIVISFVIAALMGVFTRL
jgi:hypothetical protein